MIKGYTHVAHQLVLKPILNQTIQEGGWSAGHIRPITAWPQLIIWDDDQMSWDAQLGPSLATIVTEETFVLTSILNLRSIMLQNYSRGWSVSQIRPITVWPQHIIRDDDQMSWDAKLGPSVATIVPKQKLLNDLHKLLQVKQMSLWTIVCQNPLGFHYKYFSPQLPSHPLGKVRYSRVIASCKIQKFLFYIKIFEYKFLDIATEKVAPLELNVASKSHN